LSVAYGETANPVPGGADDRLTERHLAIVGDLDAIQRDRPPTTPPYYLGRPPSFWLDLFRNDRNRA
jgi:hypothetical protein